MEVEARALAGKFRKTKKYETNVGPEVPASGPVV